MAAAAAALVLLAAAAAATLVLRADGGFDGAVLVLLEDNTLLTLDRRGDVAGRIRLGRRPAEPLAGRYLTLSGPRELRAIASGGRHDELVFLTLGDGVRRRVALAPGVRFRAIEAGHRSGRLYLAGDRATALRSEFDGRAHSAVLSVVARDGAELATATLHAPRRAETRFGPRDWSVYDLAVAHDERHLLVSYHGPNTGGADSVRLDDGAPARCTPDIAGESCVVRVHGAVEPDGAGFLATLGTPPLLGRFTADGRPGRTWRSGFRDAHLMELARDGMRVLTLESCAKTGGMTVVDLRRDRAEVVHPPGAPGLVRGVQEPRAVCGERISVGRDSLVAVMKRGALTGIAGVLLLDGDREPIRWLPLDPAPIDVLVLP